MWGPTYHSQFDDAFNCFGLTPRPQHYSVLFSLDRDRKHILRAVMLPDSITRFAELTNGLKIYKQDAVVAIMPVVYRPMLRRLDFASR